jgi:hypothetical protein
MSQAARIRQIGGRFRSVRVGLRHRALAVQASEDELLWVWIGTHAQYDQLFKKG